MNKEEYIKIINKRLKGNSKKIMINQINNYFNSLNYKIKNKYKVGDKVLLKKGTLLHGTYKNLDGLKEIINNGLLSSFFIEARTSKYPSSVGVWNIKEDIYLKDYVNYYSGGTITCFNHNNKDCLKKIISYNEMNNFNEFIKFNGFLTWKMEQTKEARFLPSLTQDQVQIGIIFNSHNKYIKTLLKGDILNYKNINDKDVKPFVHESYYEEFIINRKNKDCYFTDRESAILFGIPSNFIEGIIVGRTYEKDNNILNTIKSLLPNCYICNIYGIVIK